MSSIPPINPRTTSVMRQDSLLAQLQQTRQSLFEKQQQISTGEQYQQPSDAPGEVSSLLYLKDRIAARGQHQHNLDHAGSVLNTADQALGDAADVLREAQSLASSQIGAGSDPETRQSQAHVVDAQIENLMRIANRGHNGTAVFGGDSGAGSDGRVFESFLGGIRYTGSHENLRTIIGDEAREAFNSNGVDAFGALSGRVKSEVDLSPQPVADTPLTALDGAQGRGVRQGAIELTVNGAKTTVNLESADTLGDVTTRINDAINNINPSAGSLGLSGSGFALTANGGNAVAIGNVENGHTAADLGIDVSAAAGTTAGANVRTQLTGTTKLSNLGPSIDLGSGLTITQGSRTKTVDFTGDTTVQAMQNTIEGLDLGLRLEINKDRTGVNLVSDVSGVELSIRENGGATGEDLGLLTFGRQTSLADFRHGAGVKTVEGKDDLSISLHDGTRFKMNLDDASTVDDVISQIETAAGGAGVAVGSDFTVGLANDGGLELTDNTGGGEAFEVTNAGGSQAASHLGIDANVGAANTVNGEDRATVRAENAFTHLMALRESLKQNDSPGITFAGSKMETDLDQVIQARGEVSARAKQVDQAKATSEDRELAEQSMLSKIEDTNMSEAITRFTQLQQQLQASLQVGGQIMQQSLLNFLR